jgi:hypothetical protein
MKVIEIINRAYIFSGINSILGETQPDQVSNGLFLLNHLLSLKNADDEELPYYQTIELTANAGQSEYFVPNMYSLDCMTFNIGDTRYSLKAVTRKVFFGNSRQDNIRSMPSEFYYEKVNGGCKVILYFSPADTYVLKFVGLKGFEPISNVDIELNDSLDISYQSYLILELAKHICLYMTISIPPLLANNLEEIKKKMKNNNAVDTSFGYISPFTSQSGTYDAFSTPFRPV